jgi:putative heme-binding domain-containing protein
MRPPYIQARLPSAGYSNTRSPILKTCTVGVILHSYISEVTTLRAILSLLLILPLCAQLADQKEIPKNNPFQSSSDMARGKQLFLGHCAPCHGPEGGGGKGANLAQSVLPRGADDAALFTTIQKGIPGTEMPGAWEMTDHEVWQVTAFVRTLGRVAAGESASGNPARGRQLARSNCLQCHSIGAEGVAMGPDLSTIGLRRNTAFLRRALLDPKTSIPEGYAFVDILTTENQRVSGFRLSEDTYTVQVRDLRGRLYSFRKTDLSDYRKDVTRTPMPSFQTTLSGADREDLVAYLVSLRGAQ